MRGEITGWRQTEAACRRQRSAGAEAEGQLAAVPDLTSGQKVGHILKRGDEPFDFTQEKMVEIVTRVKPGELEADKLTG